MADGQHLPQAEAFIRENTALYRHYRIEEVQAGVKQFTGVNLTDGEAVSIVSHIRNERGMGPIDGFNLPGFVSRDEDDPEPTRPWWKFW